MNKEQFLKELERLLQGIPENEKREALSYYEEYFDDAGGENEQQVLERLGSPMQVAVNIKEGLRGSIGYQNTGTNYQNSGFQHIETQNVYTAGISQKREGLPGWAIVLIVFGCILCSPVLLGVAGTLLGAAASVFFGLLGLIIGLGAAGIALIISAVILIPVGCTLIPVNGFAALLLIGIGFLLAGIGLLLLLATVWLCGWALPAFVKWIVKLCQKPFGKKNEMEMVQ